MADEKWYPWEDVERRGGRRARPWLWIGLPMLIGILLVGGLITAVLGLGFGTIRTWADVSLIVVLLPLCLMSFLPLLLLIGLSYGIGRLVGWLPDPLGQVDHFLAQVAREARRGAGLLTRPVMALRGFLAMVETFLRGVSGLMR